MRVHYSAKFSSYFHCAGRCNNTYGTTPNREACKDNDVFRAGIVYLLTMYTT